MWGRLLGALIGGSLGLLFQSPWASGALAGCGLALGWWVLDREPIAPNSERPPSRAELISEPITRKVPRTDPGLVLARALCPLFIEVARADAAVSQLEIRVVREFFELKLRVGEAGLESVRTALKEALAAPPIELASMATKARARLAPPERLQLIDSLYEMALVDGELKRTESEAIKQVVSAFNLSDEQLATITATYLGSGLKHYAVLGVTEAASDDEVRSAFKRLAAENHPDRVAHLGPAEATAAGARFRQVKDAWDALRKIRGL